MRYLTIILIIFLFFACNKAADVPIKQNIADDNKNESQIKKELDEFKKNLKGEVRIKLKKDGKGAYAWEIAGKDVNEVLKTNDILRRKLGD